MTLRFAQRLARRFVPPALTVAALVLCSGRANADITLFDQDGWSFRINGLVAAHYQLVQGDADPNARLSLAGGRILDEGASANEVNSKDRKLTMSDIRSGFIGTQIGFGVTRRITPTVRVESQLAISVAGINSNRGQDLAFPKEGDYREAWAAIVSPYGTLRFGRMFGVFGEGSAEVQLMAWRYGVGHPCVVNHATISCGSSGAGPIYPGFDGAIRYISPRLAGFEFVVSVADPVVSPQAKISPYPRVDTELNFDQTWGSVHVRGIFQSMYEQVGFTNNTNPADKFIQANTIWGVMGTGIISIGGLTLGGGGWTGQGIGERIPLEANDPANPISNDNSGKFRMFQGVYGNAQLNFWDNSITAGGGELFVKPTPLDEMAVQNFVLTNQYEGHVVFNHRWDSIVFNVEYMWWHTKWLDDPTPPDPAMPTVFAPPIKQTLNFVGAGVNYFW